MNLDSDGAEELLESVSLTSPPIDDPAEVLSSIKELFSVLFIKGNDKLLTDLDFLFAISSSLAPRELGPNGDGRVLRLSNRFIEH